MNLPPNLSLLILYTFIHIQIEIPGLFVFRLTHLAPAMRGKGYNDQQYHCYLKNSIIYLFQQVTLWLSLLQRLVACGS